MKTATYSLRLLVCLATGLWVLAGAVSCNPEGDSSDDEWGACEATVELGLATFSPAEAKAGTEVQVSLLATGINRGCVAELAVDCGPTAGGSWERFNSYTALQARPGSDHFEGWLTLPCIDAAGQRQCTWSAAVRVRRPNGGFETDSVDGQTLGPTCVP